MMQLLTVPLTGYRDLCNLCI